MPDVAAFVDVRSKELSDRMKQFGSDIEMTDLVYTGERNHVMDYLRDIGWAVSASPIREAYAANGFDVPDDTVMPRFLDLSYVPRHATTERPFGPGVGGR